MPSKSRLPLNFSNVVSMLALFVALSGSAYAAGVLAPNSVGRAQLQSSSVTTAKIADNSIGSSKLKPGSVTASELASDSVGPSDLQLGLRQQLTRLAARPSTSRLDSAGTVSAGPPGPVGPRGPGAIRVHYLEQASASPDRVTVTEIDGLRMEALCEDTNPGTQMNLAVSSPEAAHGVETISVDGGSGAPGFGESQSANLQIDLPAGTTSLGGPSAEAGHYSRVFADLIYVAPKSTVNMTIGLVIDGTAGTCAVDGVAVPATS